MHVKTLSIVDFKNIAEASLALSPGINCFVGDNGAGKTNAVDAIHYLSMCKSSLPTSDNQNIRHGAEFFLLDANYRSDTGRDDTVVCSYRKGGSKVVKRNGKEYGRISEHIGTVPTVMISPSDSFLVTDSAEERRRFLNAFLSQLDRSYLNWLIRYNQVLAERNRLLKTGMSGTDLTGVYDMQLADLGQKIYNARKEVVEKLAPLVEQHYCYISGDSEKVRLEYRSELSNAAMIRLLEQSREKDLANQYTTCGIHRDDLKMKIAEQPLRKYGSQGQQKSFLVALKLAQYRILSAEKGEKPLLLLDDIFDKLDADRGTRLLQMVSGEGFGQIFITDCNRDRVVSVLENGNARFMLFDVDRGNIICK